MTDLRNKVTKEQLDELVAQSKVEYAVFGKKLTVAVITLPTNFKVTGEASCVDASNFNKELGETYALENAVKKLWELEGYLLANDRYRAKQAVKEYKSAADSVKAKFSRKEIEDMLTPNPIELPKGDA